MTPHTLEVLRLLHNGEFQSGEAIGKALGITRGSVSNALANIDEFGLTVHKVHGRGYRLVTPVQWLSRDEILEQLGGRAARFDIEVVDETGSTNTDLLERAAQGGASGTVLVAELQTLGRGRRGRDWHSGLGGALTFSVLWRFEQGAGFLSGLSLVVGIALARVLRRHGAEDVMLKWPNDVLWRHLKLAGILIELAGDVMGPTVAVVGVGINLRLPESVKARIDQPVADLARIGIEVDRNRLFAEILAELDVVLSKFSNEGFAPFREEWDRMHAYQDRMVRLRMPDKTELEGKVEGVAEDGALMIKTRSGARKFYGGELSLRPAA
ncbi:MAG TPA: biotin--[acetyl-CoA-carboxylase] ligase [Burkholderiales bacterium]|nr:biotin--[acetyl-CoA-carboxylase] ligase [Burkholderiales bacterium]